MNGVRAAIAFLTRIPVRAPQDAVLAHAVPWFPLVGVAVGGVGAGVYFATSQALPPIVAATLAIIATVAVTGAFHEDGLADVADALGGWDPEQRRRILADPTHGTYGVLGLVLSVVVRVATLSSLSGWYAAAALIAAHAFGRSAAVVLMVMRPAAGTGGLGAAYARDLSPARSLTGAAVGLAVLTTGLGFRSIAAIAIVTLTTALLGRWSRRALGGTTGDVLGAVEQLGEVGVLVSAAAFR